MKINKLDIKIVILIIIAFLILFFVGYLIIENKIDELKKDRYNEVALSMQEQLKTHIAEKQKAISYISLIISKNSDIAKAIVDNNYKALNLQEVSSEFKKKTNLENLTFHIVTKDGISFLKSWTSVRGENVLSIRPDIRKNLIEKKFLNNISVGKFNMTFKSAVPIYYKDQFVGIFETVAKFNSIIKNMKVKDYKTIIFVDKSYKKQLIYPEGEFMDDYFVINGGLHGNEDNYIASVGVDAFINNNKQKKTKYTIYEQLNKLETIYVLNDITGKPMAYCAIFYPLDKINMEDINEIRTNLLGMSFSALLFFGLIVYYFYIKRYSMVLEQLNTELIEQNQLAAKLNRELEESEHELGLINENLQAKIAKAVEENEQQQKQLFEQAKHAQMGEMIGNIAHQWRQPLSLISTASTGMLMQKEFGVLSDEQFVESCKMINESAQYLSKTIDDFRNFIKVESNC